ncbi:hypothetical protein CVIRNUC_005791 [Coccomyxa viridis]|uniref:Uncharacterized protein n=1 Tax=Coccomyxa viridis TaxID=1274662 RepID=A0AAV1I5F1_9CHLO|nr:hypothetical protein CVIRNUC_005791 [Coccomyxa viridis]
MAATSDVRRSSFTVDSTRTSQTFTQEDVVDLLEQMAGHLKVQLEHRASLWAMVIMAATNGLKGLSGAILMRV